MDERKQFVPTDFDTYTAKNNTVGLVPQTTMETASDRDNDYKVVEDVPTEQSKVDTNHDRRHEWYDNL